MESRPYLELSVHDGRMMVMRIMIGRMVLIMVCISRLDKVAPVTAVITERHKFIEKFSPSVPDRSSQNRATKDSTG